MLFGFCFVKCCLVFLFFFFFQAEDGIRDRDVTGVQTCALPISTASASGLVPTGAFAYGASSIVRVTVSAAVSTTEIESLSVFATYRSPFTELTARALGCVPTVIDPAGAPVAAFTIETVLPPQLETYAFVPSFESATAYGLWPTSVVELTVSLAVSMIDTDSPRSFAT